MNRRAPNLWVTPMKKLRTQTSVVSNTAVVFVGLENFGGQNDVEWACFALEGLLAC